MLEPPVLLWSTRRICFAPEGPLYMTRFLKSQLLMSAVLVVGMLALPGLAFGATPYVITNDDSSFPSTGVSFYSVAANGTLTLQQQVATLGVGIGGGFFGASRIKVIDGPQQPCVYASEAGSGSIVGISINTLTVGGSANGSETDSGASNGMGLASNGQFLYASYGDSNTIGAFQLESGCSLNFIGDTSVTGVEGGQVNAIAAHENILIATYTDGTIESFTISGGVPITNGDKQISTATVQSKDATYPNSIDITSDGHFAIFGDTSTSMVVEVSDISSGKLAKTVVQKSTASINSSNVILSPDETLLYVINTQGDSVSALFFNRKNGQLNPGCTSGRIRGHSVNWSYLAGPALINQKGTGGGVYVAEFGVQSGIAMVKINVSGKTCTLHEVSSSPFANSNSPGLLSIGAFPPRSF